MIRFGFFSVFLLTLGTFNGCVADAPYKFAGSTVPEQLSDGWDIAPPESVNINRADLENIYSRLLSPDEFFNAKTFLVVKDNKLVFEVQLRDPRDRDHYTHIQSITKSVTSLILGMVQSDGFIDSVNQTLYSIIPDKFPSDATKRTISLRHLMTMTSGLLLDNDDFSVELFVNRPADPPNYFLNKPLYASPGERFYYRDVDPHLLSYAILRLTGKTEEELAKERLFGPLGIQDYYWQSDHTGTTAGAVGLHLRPRDMAKIGQTVLDNGRWKGIQVVDSTWISVSTRKQVDIEQTTTLFLEYGFYWWIVPQWQAFSAMGHGGSFIFIRPASKLICVLTSMPDAGDDVGPRLDRFVELISPLLN